MSQFNYSPLLTDLYQLTMAYGYWKLNMHERRAVFHLLFRNNPFKGNYALCCGLDTVVAYLKQWQFQADELSYLETLQNPNETPLFSRAFLDYLASLRFTCHLDAIPEGTVVFSHEPLIRIEGPLLQCQLLESPLLNLMNFQTLIATKAARICQAAQGDDVIEFGLRRAQGPDGALSASRAAYIGGCMATSNTLAGKEYGIPLRGTHAHSWVTAFPSELKAFEAYAATMPHNAVLLVDTYGSLDGVVNAIKVGHQLRAADHDLLGIRLDSGEMASLSIQARKLLDEAGFEDTPILASNALDESVIRDLKQQGAKISAWGIGTNLVTSHDQPALDGVYKLSALQNESGEWEYKLKLSDDPIKISNPGRHQVRRFFYEDAYVIDVIYDLSLGISDSPHAHCSASHQEMKNLDNMDAFVDLLQPVFQDGQLIGKTSSIHTLREQAMHAVNEFNLAHADQPYPVALESHLFELKQTLISHSR